MTSTTRTKSKKQTSWVVWLLSCTLIFNLAIVGSAPTASAASGDPSTAIATLLDSILNDVPDGQSTVSYANNYQSMEPESMTFVKGGASGAVTVNNGMTIALGTGNPALATWDKGPWLSAGVIDMSVRATTAPGNMGFSLGYFSGKAQGVTIRYTSGTSWSVLATDGTTTIPVENFTGPTFAQNTDYRVQIGFKGNSLIFAVDGVVYYNKTTNLLGKNGVLGQFGLYKSGASARTFKVNSVNIQGVGSTQKPVIQYMQNYEDPAYTPNWSGLDTKIVTDDTGNKVLSVKKGTAERGADLDSAEISSGTLSLDFKLVNPAKLGNGQGFAFDFEMNSAASLFNELGVDPNRWIPESSTTWGDTLPIPYPLQGRWNNLMLNFKGTTVTVYLNKKKIGDVTFASYITNEGLFGLRVRSGVELYIDNVIYTNQTIVPQQIKQYANDFEDGITGDWDGATPSLVQEGNNQILKLSGLNGTAANKDSVVLQSATYTAKLKSESTDIGLAIGSGYAVKYAGGKWVLTNGTQTVDFQKQDALESSPRTQKWNKIGLQYNDSSVALSINGAALKADLPNGSQFGAGKLGVYGHGDVFLDDIVYTEEFTDVDTAWDTSKLFYEQYYVAAPSIDWTGLVGASVADGYLSGTIAAGGVAVNTAVAQLNNGVFQAKLQADNARVGIKLGNMAVYHAGQGSWVYSYDDGSEVAIGSGPVIQPGKDVIIRLQVVEKALKLYVNGSLVGSAAVSGYKAGAFGLYNPGAQALAVKLGAVGAEELRIYQPDYTAANWSALDGTPTVESNGNGSATLNMPGVALASDMNAPSMIDQLVSFDFKTDAAGDATGGRYGFMLRALDSRNYVSVTYDINGNWKLSANGNETSFPVAYPMDANKTYHIDLNLIGGAIAFKITNPEGETTDIGAAIDNQMTMKPGKFGLRSWYAAKKLTVSNVKIVEQESLPKLQLAMETDTIVQGDMTVTVNKDFPTILSYRVGSKTMSAGSARANSLTINNVAYKPQTTAEKIGDSTYKYTMNIAEIGVTVEAKLEAKAHNVVRFEVTNIKESGDFVVRTVQLNDTVLDVNSALPGSTYAWGKSDGKWHGITEDIIDDMSKMEVTGAFGATMVMVSANGLGASVETNGMSGGNRVLLNIEKKPLMSMLTATPGQWIYRHAQSMATEKLPWYEVVVTEDRNADGKVDWQDAAVAYREEIYVEPFGANDMKNNMMYIAFNFASQANDPFLNTLDTGKVLYNYTDGFGQKILHKGYQAEGHDDEIPSYSNIGVRQGGLKDFNYLIDEGAKYNLKVGVHLNATEYHMDANELYYPNIDGATAAGYKVDKLSGGWDWIDTSYYVDQTKDVLSGQLKSRFTNLYNLTKDPSKPDDPALDFFYIDVYTGNDYNASKLLEYANDLGVSVGTEFDGPMEPGVTFTHWGPDLGYPNTGNGSILSRMVKNDLDIFVGNALFKGQKIPGVTTWGDSKPDLQQGVFVFYNEVLPTKFMQHYGVMKYETDQVTFDNNVISKRNKDKNRIELSEGGKLISYWKDTGTTTDASERHTSEATSLIPWTWDIKTNKTLGINEGAKLYHWNPAGGDTTWELTDEFKDVPAFNMYELTQQGKAFVKQIAAVNGSVTIAAAKNTPYVLYPASADALSITPAAGNWGEGSLIKDFAFNSEKLNEGAWAADDTNNIAIKVQAGDAGYDTTVETSKANWNRYAEVNANGGVLSQDIGGLIPGQDYTVGVWTQTPKGRKSSLEVTVGDATYSNDVSGIDGTHYSSFKYLNTTWQRMNVQFKAPVGVTQATVKLKADAGSGVVLYDDARIWQHLTTANNLNKPGYAVYEDFENVYEGWGPFEYGGGSRKLALTSYQSNANADNPLVSASDNKVGPVMTWVLDGTTSFKINETDKNQLVKTSESGMKLQPNTKYELGFIYTMEPKVTYTVSVKSRSSGATLLTEALTSMSNPGTHQGEDGGYKRYKKEFTTGNLDDYQVIFQMTNVTGSAEATAKYAFILDDFYVKTMDMSFWKDQLAQSVSRAQALDASIYTAESWSGVADALTGAAAAAANEDATVAELEAAINNLDHALNALVKAAVVTGIADVTVETNVGQAPTLPSVVEVTYDDQTSGELPVTWDDIDAEQYAKAGSFTVAGTVAGTTTKAVATVKVVDPELEALKAKLAADLSAARNLKEADYTAESWAGVAQALDAATAAANNDDATAEELSNAIGDLESALGALVVKVEVAGIEDVSVETEAGTAPTLPTVVTVTYSDDTSGKLAVLWDEIDPGQYAEPGSFTVEGTVPGTGLKAVAHVTVKESVPEVAITSIDGVSVSTTIGTKPTLPAVVTVKYSDDTSGKLAVTWDDIDAAQYAKAGSFTVAGTVPGTSLKAVATVTVKRTSGGSTGNNNDNGNNGNNDSGNNGNPGSGTDNAAGKPDIGKADLQMTKETTADGAVVNKVEIASDTLAKALAAANSAGSANGRGAKVTIDVTGMDGSIQLTLPGAAFAAAGDKYKDTILLIESDATVYELPADLLPLDAFAARSGTTADQVSVRVTIEPVAEDVLAVLKQKAGAMGATLALDQAFTFSITLAANGRTEEFENFGTTYTSRTLYLSHAVNPEELAAVMFDPATGEFTPVPAKLVTIDGKQAIELKRPGNSVYTVLRFKKQFADLDGHWAKADIELMASKLIVKGMTDSSFDPGKNITRAEFATLLVRALGLTPDAEAAAKFADVDGSAWYAGYVGTAVKYGLATGVDSDRFAPGKAITRAEMAVMAARALGMVQGAAAAKADTSNLAKFKDAGSMKAWATDSIAELVELGVLNGVTDNTFAPDAMATRAEASVILLRAMRVLEFI